MIFADFEASGLHHGSYPIEIGWCSHDLRTGWSTLIRPVPAWLEAGWNPESEKLHGVSRHQVMSSGHAADEVVQRLNNDLADQQVMTDNPDWDARWLWRLYDAASTLPTFAVLPKESLTGGPFSTVLHWRGVAMSVDSEAVITLAAKKAGVDASEHKLFAAALNAEAGIVPHRALHDAVAHALSLGAVALLELANHRGDAAAAAAKGELVGRARRLLADQSR
jgi:hypothetical protein